jgi:hypothetical protein
MVAYNEVRQWVYYYLFIVGDAPKKRKDLKIQDLELSQSMQSLMDLGRIIYINYFVAKFTMK